MGHILNIENLSIGYTNKKRKTIIATDINVSISKPKFIALLGENGIGKSTLLRTISNVQKIIAGTILIENKNSTNYNFLELSKKMSIVLTERIPPSNLTVYELITLGRQGHTNWIGTLSTTDKIIINDAINQVNIHSIKDNKVDELSDGQYQKVMIARALAQDTSIILLDEPTAHLDIINKAEIFKLLKELSTEKRKTIIISSHELQLAIQTADDLWLMTEKEFISGDKTTLIDNGSLQRLFKSALISFDKESNQFIFH